MKKQDYNLFFLLAASVLCSLLFMPAYNGLYGDTEIFLYVGRQMRKGSVPYRDIFDHKPPLIFFLNYAGLLLGSWGQWIIDTGITLLATVLFYRLCKRYKLAFPWILPLLFNLMLRDYLICMSMGFTREYTAIGVLIFFCVLLDESKSRYYWLGLLSGLIFFMQQEQAFQLIPFLLYSFIKRDERLSIPMRIVQVGIGFTALLLPLVLYFAVNHSLSDFWNDAFSFNIGWYTTTFKESFGVHLRRVKRVLDAGNFEVVFMVSTLLGIASLFFRHTDKKLLLTALAGVVLSMIPEFMGGRSSPVDFYHYFIPLSASLCILLFVVFAFTGESALLDRKMQGIFCLLAGCSVFYTALAYGTHLRPKSNTSVASSASMQYLRKHPPRDYQLYQFGNSDFVYAYNEFKITAPTRWIYQNFWKLYNNWDADHAILQGIIDDLSRHHTKYILDCIYSDHWFQDRGAYELWHSFLIQNYEEVLQPQWEADARLWKLKGTAE